MCTVPFLAAWFALNMRIRPCHPTSSYLIIRPWSLSSATSIIPWRHWDGHLQSFSCVDRHDTHIHRHTHTHTHTTHMAMMDTCASAYLHEGGVFVLDSCSTSQGLAVCPSCLGICHQMKRAPLGLRAWIAWFLWLLSEAGSRDHGEQGNSGGNKRLSKSVQRGHGRISEWVNEDIWRYSHPLLLECIFMPWICPFKRHYFKHVC